MVSADMLLICCCLLRWLQSYSPSVQRIS